MNIRKAKLGDLKEISKIEFNNKYFDSYEACLKNTRKLLKNELIFVAYKNNILGYISLKRLKNNGSIEFLAVDKKYRNKGIGSNLIKYLVIYSKKIGLNKIILGVRENNRTAVRLYKKSGFKLIDQKRKGRITKLVMKKLID